MADNITVTPGTGATVATVAADDVSSVLHQLVKIEYGGDGTATPVTTSAPLPVELRDNGNTVVADISAVKTAVQVMDDWDESDRAKVNPIVGQAGVAAGAGAVSATVQRTTLASDDPAVVALQIMDDWDNGASDGASVSGDVAADAVDAGEPVKIGFKAYSFDGTAPGTSVAEADRANGISDLDGRQFVETGHPFSWHVSADYGSAQTNTSVKAAPGASLKLYITDIFISNGATAGNITLLDGSGGTVLFECYPAINGGAVLNMKNPIRLTANTALCITSTTVTTHSITICGFTAA